MRQRSTDRLGMTTGVSVAIMLLILVLAGTASYLAFSQGTIGPSTTSSTSSSVTTVYISNTTSSSTPTSSVSTSASSSSSSSSTSSRSSSSASSATVSTSSVTLNSSEVQVIIPQGIENIANKISFEPINITIVIGVNNTIVFTNHDDQEHILESTSWPQDGQPFQFYSLPGQSNSVTFATPGKYTYFCEWHPIWMDGTITVIA
ncbi:MAG: cupredoxin domain-containing protein [Thaumarchaeota archaeon]|nr:cupredoxin domain-containing protein [Nitrososphaerota archaeon]